MHLQKSVRSMRNRLDVPNGQGKPLPERPETQKTTCTPRSCAKRQSPSKAHMALGSLRLSNGADFPPLFYLQDKDGAQYHRKSRKRENDTVAQFGLPKDTDHGEDNDAQYTGEAIP